MTGPANDKASVLGRDVPRVDALPKVTGRAVYTDDLDMPGLLVGKILRSTAVHARIQSIDTRAAEAVPGVIAVLTAEDLADTDPYFGVAYRDQPVVAIGRVRFLGEPVAAVAALTEDTATLALEKIEVRTEELLAVQDPEAAMAPGAPRLHDHLRPAGSFGDLAHLLPDPARNICHQYHYARGDVEAGFARSDFVFEDVFTLPPVAPFPLEPYAVIARFEDGMITVWSSTQNPFPVARDLASIFRVPLSAVRVIAPYLGGGFGAKAYSKVEPLAVALARKAGRPVRLCLSLEETFQTLTRHAAICRSKIGVARDGTILVKRVEVILDTGAYADTGPRVCNKVGLRAQGPYRIPDYQIDAYCVYTHKVPAGSLRGFGGPQVGWACESQMDMVARRLGIDPLAFRLQNILRQGETYQEGRRPIDCDLEAMLRRAADEIGWGTPSPPGRGKGIAFSFKDGGGSRTVSTAIVRLHADGSVTIQAGSAEIGQGAFTVLSQVAAMELGIGLDRIRVAPTDTLLVPYDQTTSMSRTTVSMGLAVQRAAADIRHQLREFAALAWKVAPADVEVERGKVRAAGRVAAYEEVIAQLFGMPAGEIIGRGYVFSGPPGTPMADDRNFWEVGVQAVEVAVDSATGQLTLLRAVSVLDAGRALNPALCETQDEGAMVQGIGHALYEALVFEEGQLLNPNPIDYRVPLAEDIPMDFRSIVVEHGGGPGPHGAKGVSEGGVVGAAPAIANALEAAVGVRVMDLPLTPERIWRAMTGTQGRGAG